MDLTNFTSHPTEYKKRSIHHAAALLFEEKRYCGRIDIYPAKLKVCVGLSDTHLPSEIKTRRQAKHEPEMIKKTRTTTRLQIRSEPFNDTDVRLKREGYSSHR
ncbi:hypothetical protein QQF64_001632 [Cirrhinus molitorella]|uniref:Uncharacterized protein n=1 Tax=Cirrhinus molitorella TaxID=172907 RepID=A0ABR3P116_9TELE